MFRIRIATVVACLALASECFGQATIAQPYNGQLRSDPAVGNVQGIQRYGRPLKCDPDEGTGYSYHVYPVTDGEDNSVADAIALASYLTLAQSSARQNVFEPSAQAQPDAENAEEAKTREAKAAQDWAALMLTLRQGPRYGGYGAPFPGFGGPYSPGYPNPYPAPFDATAGLRNYSTPLGAPESLKDPGAVGAMLGAKAFGYEGPTLDLIEIYHQPLIQVKVRVVEVVRNDGMRANSILEYVSRKGESSLTSGEPANEEMENVRGISRFMDEGLVTAADMGSGILFNLTSEHINWALQLLATEFNADVITAPEVVTLNGQNVEFLSGQKIPFQIGQNVIQGTNNNIQQFFYKNIGTLVSVTPKIVNWGYHGEGAGEAAIVDSEIKDWNALVVWMLDTTHISVSSSELRSEMTPYSTNSRPLPFQLKSDMLKELNRYTRSDIVGRHASPMPDASGPGSQQTPPRSAGELIIPSGQTMPCLCETGACSDADWPFDPSVYNWFRPDEEWIRRCRQCDWKPEDCTIDMAIVVRLSDPGAFEATIDTDNADPQEITLTSEDNVRAVANVIQVKSGNGVVMAGLIGEREEEAVAKVPVLGDIPWVGAAFRSKETIRQKTEVLIFVEAQVLDPRPDVARAESYQDYRLSQSYVEGSFLDNPLECGMYRAGLGTYLPPIRCGEECFWTRYHRKVRKICTYVDDVKE